MKNSNSERKGIYYYENRNKLYKGDLKNRKLEGKRIKYYENGNKEFEGEYKSDRLEKWQLWRERYKILWKWNK